MTIEFFIGILVGSAIAVLAWLLTTLVNRKSKPKKLLTIDDLVIPELLPLFKDHCVERGLTVNDTHIIMTWDHDNCSCQREYKIHTLTSVEDFKKAWHTEEVGFYLRNVSVFGKSKHKKRAKK